jgi:hypothetical protein
MNKLVSILIPGVVAFAFSALAATPLPNPAVVSVADSYSVGVARGKVHLVNLKGSFGGSSVYLSYVNPATGSTDDVAGPIVGPVSGLLVVPVTNQLLVRLTGAAPGISVEVTQADPVAPMVSNADGSTVAVVQERDGLVRTDTATSAAAGGIYVQECTGLHSVTVACSAAGAGGALVGEVSNDNVTWQGVAGYLSNSIGSTGSFITSPTVSAGLAVQYPTPGKYFRLRQTAYTSGSFTYVSVFRSESIPKMGVYIGNTGTTSVSTQGAGAAGAAVVGNPVAMGIVARTANSPVTNGTSIYPLATLAGAQIVRPYSIPEGEWSYVPPVGGLVNSATAVAIRASGGAGLRNYITSLELSTDALGSACDLVVLDGAAVIYRKHLQTTGIPLGINIDFPTPLKGTAATALNIQTLVSGTATAVTGGIYVNAQGYTAP